MQIRTAEHQRAHSLWARQSTVELVRTHSTPPYCSTSGCVVRQPPRAPCSTPEPRRVSRGTTARLPVRLPTLALHAARLAQAVPRDRLKSGIDIPTRTAARVRKGTHRPGEGAMGGLHEIDQPPAAAPRTAGAGAPIAIREEEEEEPAAGRRPSGGAGTGSREVSRVLSTAPTARLPMADVPRTTPATVIVTFSHGHDVLAIIITFDTFAIDCIVFVVFVHCAGGSIGIIIISAALGVVHSYVATPRNLEVA